MRSLASLAGGAAAGQIVAVLASPIITRHYTPAEIGAFSVFSTAAMLLNSTNSVRYEMAIPVAEDEETAGHLVWLCFLLVTGFSLLLCVAVWFWGAGFCRWVKVPSLNPYLWLLPLTVAAAGAYEALNFATIRRQDFGSLAQSRVISGVAQSGIQVAMGLASMGTIGLLLGDLAGRVTSSLRLVWDARFLGTFRSFPWKGIKKAAVEFVRFPKYMAGASILNLAAIQIPFLLVPVFFGAEAAGHYFLAYRTLFLPASFIGGTISQVFLGEAAERAREGDPLKHITSRIFLLLSAVYLPIYTISLAGAGQLFPAVFGARWGEAGHFAQVLAPMTLVWSLARPICGMLLVRDRLKESLAFTVFELLGMVAAIYFGQLSGSVYRTAIYISASGLLVSITSVGRFLHAAGVEFGPVMRRFGYLFVLNVPLGLMVWGATRVTSALGTLAVALAGFAAVAALTLRYLRREKLL
jgi:O-antigen/teichoic acid export membrane protein